MACRGIKREISILESYRENTLAQIQWRIEGAITEQAKVSLSRNVDQLVTLDKKLRYYHKKQSIGNSTDLHRVIEKSTATP